MVFDSSNLPALAVGAAVGIIGTGALYLSVARKGNRIIRHNDATVAAFEKGIAHQIAQEMSKGNKAK